MAYQDVINRTSKRRFSTDSGVPSSKIENKPREETELKRPIGRHNMSFGSEDITSARQNLIQSNTSDISCLTSHLTDTKNETKGYLNTIFGKSEAPYIHIKEINIYNSKPNHSPPAACCNNYTYIKDEVKDITAEEISKYFNVGYMGREGINQESILSSTGLAERELHAMKMGYRSKMTSNSVTDGRDKTYMAPKKTLPVVQTNESGYNHHVASPVLNIEGSNLNGKVEITLKTKETIWRGELSQAAEECNAFYKDEISGNTDVAPTEEQLQNKISKSTCQAFAYSAPILNRENKTDRDNQTGKRWFSERNIFRQFKVILSRPKKLHVSPDCAEGFYYPREEEKINLIKKCLLHQGQDSMWFITFLDNSPGYAYCLHIKIDRRVYSYPVSQDNRGKLSIDIKFKKIFSCLCKLITYYRSNALPNNHLTLGEQPFVGENNAQRSI